MQTNIDINLDSELDLELGQKIQGVDQSDTEPKPNVEPKADDAIMPIDNFEDMNLSYDLLHGIISYGFERPSYVQSYAIQLFNLNRDIVVQSQSGTGKTGAFLIGALNRIDPNINGCQLLVILPTRELARQVYTVCSDISTYMNIKTLLFVRDDTNRINFTETRNILNNNPCIVIGTPGKVCYFIDKNILKFNFIKFIIMDEADELLKDEFLKDIQKIVKNCSYVNICLFSATMPEKFMNTINQFLINPIIHILKPEELTLDGIKQYYILVKNYSDKFNVLKELYNKMSINQAIIYVNEKKRASELKSLLAQQGFTISVIHGSLSTEERNNIMLQFKSGKTRILISTDLLSRGIDIQQISVVINYELPDRERMDSYIHRIGRSGRFGRKGIAINLVHIRELYKIEAIQKMYHTVVDEMPYDNCSNIL